MTEQDRTLESGIDRAVAMLRLNAMFARKTPKLRISIEPRSICIGVYVRRAFIHVYPLPCVVITYRRDIRSKRLPSIRAVDFIG